MNKTATKRNKKEEQKKLIVRIVCMVLVVALAVTSLLTVFPTLFQQDQTYSMQELIDAGIVYQGEDGNYYFTEAYLNTAAEEVVEEPAEEAAVEPVEESQE